MARMARHGSAPAFSGFSVCQPALGAALQWLPAIGTPELDDMINALLPGPASIQDKRAHISMDFFEYSRQTGENFKFYPVPPASFTPVAASPASSGYGSSFSSQSPVVSDQGSWTQSPAPVAPARPRASASKRSSTSSSRQSAIDFANHPGMRILTRDGRDVTNSVSRGCKTKEQRDHAHLMRIIKACDSCRRKKVRCDPSHRKRNASQASALLQAEQKPAKKARKREEPPPAAVAEATADLLAGSAFDALGEPLSFSSLETAYPQDFEQFWNDFITFDPEPVAAVAAPTHHDFLIDPLALPTDFSPSLGSSSSTSPSQVFTPSTPAPPGPSPSFSPDLADVAGDVSFHDPTVPYLNPGVAHGTNYVDFNLFSPGPDVFDEDPVLQMRDLASQQRSPLLHDAVAGRGMTNNELQYISPDCDGGHARDARTMSMSRQQPCAQRLESEPRQHPETVAGASVNAPGTYGHVPWYHHDGDPTLHAEEQPGVFARSRHRRMTDSSTPAEIGSLAQMPSCRRCGYSCRKHVHQTVSAHVPQSSVSPGAPSRPRMTSAGMNCSSSSSSAVCAVGSRSSTRPGTLDSALNSSPLAAPAAVRWSTLPSQALRATTPTAPDQQSYHAVGDAAPARAPGCRRSCAGSSMPKQLLAGAASGSSARHDEQHAAQKRTVMFSATLAAMLSSILPTRCTAAGDAATSGVARSLPPSTALFQLAVFGLVSFLCASALLQARLGFDVNLVHTLAITSMSLARLALWCSGPSGATRVAPTTKPLPSSRLAPLGSRGDDVVKTQFPAVGRSLQLFRSAVAQRVGNVALPLSGAMRSFVF